MIHSFPVSLHGLTPPANSIWNFDTSQTADGGPAAATFTKTGTVNSGTGRKGNCVVLAHNGNNYNTNCLTTTAWNSQMNTGDFTIGYWTKYTTGATQYAFYSNGTSGAYKWIMDTRMVIANPVSGSTAVNPLSTPAAGTWYHSALTRKVVGANDVYTFYINGIYQGSHTQTASGYSLSSGALRFTVNASGATPSVDEVKFWNRALSAAEMYAVVSNY